MPGRTSGLERDLSLLRRRAWLFIPFFIVGILAALSLGRLTGDSNAVASMTLDTTVHDLVIGGDRGLRIFEAQEMTNDPRFKERVIAQIGDPDFDYARFSIRLSPISVADGISRGLLTVSITDPDREKAAEYRQAFVTVFSREYTQLDGLWRTRFVDRRRATLQIVTDQFNTVYTELKSRATALGVEVDALVDSRGQIAPSTYYYEQRAALYRELAEVNGARSAITTATDDVAATVASAVLGVEVAPGDAEAALATRAASLTSALSQFETSVVRVAEDRLDPETARLLDEARGLRQIKDESTVRLANATVAVTSAESYITVSYAASGGLGRSLMGRIAVVFVITIVFGLIAIYTLEWLSAGLREERGS
ncbi:MAG TPA: hypothetical protein PJ994_02195 [Tepidiformaceae bacterium]|nr:hypothetical protein [Tepidiformaceae bacterium]